MDAVAQEFAQRRGQQGCQRDGGGNAETSHAVLAQKRVAPSDIGHVHGCIAVSLRGGPGWANQLFGDKLLPFLGELKQTLAE